MIENIYITIDINPSVNKYGFSQLSFEDGVLTFASINIGDGRISMSCSEEADVPGEVVDKCFDTVLDIIENLIKTYDSKASRTIEFRYHENLW